MPKRPTTQPVPPIIEIEAREKFPRIWPNAPSLRPGLPMMEAAAEGQPEACAIRDAWQFRHPVKVMTRAEYESLIERCSGVVFTEGK